MTHVLQIAAEFLAQLGFGSAILLPLFPLRATGKSFPRFYYGFIVIVLGLFLLCLYRLGQFHPNLVGIALLAGWIWAMQFFSLSITVLEEFLMRVFAVMALFFLIVYPQKYLFHGDHWLDSLLSLTGLTLGAVFLSLTLMTMIFGHWYLVNRQLDIRHLVTVSRWLVITAYLRTASVVLAVYLANGRLEPALFSRLTDFMGHGVFFWSRILCGLLVPVVVAHLAYSSAKIKANQSATGILYAGCVFVIMGEMMALYLFSVTGMVF